MSELLELRDQTLPASVQSLLHYQGQKTYHSLAPITDRKLHRSTMSKYSQSDAFVLAGPVVSCGGMCCPEVYWEHRTSDAVDCVLLYTTPLCKTIVVDNILHRRTFFSSIGLARAPHLPVITSPPLFKVLILHAVATSALNALHAEGDPPAGLCPSPRALPRIPSFRIWDFRV